MQCPENQTPTADAWLALEARAWCVTHHFSSLRKVCARVSCNYIDSLAFSAANGTNPSVKPKLYLYSRRPRLTLRSSMLPLMQLHCCPVLGKSGLAAAPIVQPPPKSVLCDVRERYCARQTRVLATPIADAGPAATARLQGTSAHTQPSPTTAHRQQAPSETGPQRKYLSYAEYVAMQEQRQREQEQHSFLEGSGQRADETAHASTSAPSQDGSGKRVPWNKGRKHSASKYVKCIACLVVLQSTDLAFETPCHLSCIHS
jgi:hypothetical protein